MSYGQPSWGTRWRWWRNAHPRRGIGIDMDYLIMRVMIATAVCVVVGIVTLIASVFS